MAEVMSLDEHMRRVIERMRTHAGLGVFDGTRASASTRYFERARRIDDRCDTVLLLTRDVGHHSSGWWKNPDYERCWHLSVSPLTEGTRYVRQEGPGFVDFSERIRAAWVRACFGEDIRLLWAEPPYSREGRIANVWHYRLFCDAGWQPILPRGEVYDRELTEAGWLSGSEVAALVAEDEKASEQRRCDACP